MASPIAHIIYGKKIFDTLPVNLYWPEFVVGTVFPDIRYHCNLPREATHFYNTSPDKIPLDSAFTAGRYIHSLIDENLSRVNSFENENCSSVEVTASKYIIDRLIYPGDLDWKKIAGYFNTIYPDEMKIIKDVNIITGWHKVSQLYFLEGPGIVTSKKMVELNKLDSNYANHLIEKIFTLENDDRSMELIRKAMESL